MNCKEVENLLPLYIGRELEEKRAKLLTAHMDSCAACADSAEEYREAQQLLQLYEPPQFSELVYSGIRSRVLAQIEEESNALTLFEKLAALFQPRLMWSASAAVLLAVAGLGFYFMAGRMNQQRSVQQVAETRNDANPGRADQQRDERAEAKELPDTGPSTGSHATVKESIPVFSRHQDGQRRSTDTERIRSTRMINDKALAMSTQASMANQNSSEPESYPLDGSTTPEKTLRVEMQTSDPNIRIVWFSHPQTKANISNDSSKESRR